MVVRSLLAPWPGKVGRRLTVLGPTAAAVYAAAVAGVAPAVEAALGPGVHGGRVVGFAPLRIEPWSTARARHRRAALERAGGAAVALRLDVADCFRTISPQAVAAALRAVGAPRTAIDEVGRFLARTAAAGVPGLPAGPDPSVVLANAVLRALDRAAGEGRGYLRWYDDLLILAPGSAAAARLEAAIAAAAAEVGLRLHPAKRRIAVGPIAIRRLILGGAGSRCPP